MGVGREWQLLSTYCMLGGTELRAWGAEEGLCMAGTGRGSLEQVAAWTERACRARTVSMRWCRVAWKN